MTTEKGRLGGQRRCVIPEICFQPARKELRIRLPGLTEAECRRSFLHLGEFLGQFSDPDLVSLGRGILVALNRQAGEAGLSASSTV
jgi:hypothetical protein